ncbi:MAG: TetR/AcrR family transcriptional regulator [Actinomycetota bacterium]
MPEPTSTLDQRDRILTSAVQVLQDEGAGALTVRRVAAGADCSTTGVYTYFGGKEGLVDALFVEGFTSFDAALDEVGHDLVELGRTYRRWALDHSTYYLVMFGRAVPDFEPSDQAMATAARSFERLVDAVARAHPTADDATARQRAFHLWATVHGYVMLELQGMSPPGLEDIEHLFALGLGRVTDETLRR